MGPSAGAPGWPVPPTPAKKSRRGLVVLGIIGLVLVVVGGAAVAGIWLGPGGSAAGESADNEPPGGGAPPEELGIDDPRTPEPVESPGGDGGESGKAAVAAVQAAGFTCGRSEGYRAARISCYLTQTNGQVPTVQYVSIGIVDDEVTEVSAEVEIDQPWQSLPTAEEADDPFAQGPDYDIRGDAGQLLTAVGSAVVPEAEIGAVASAVGTAMTDDSADIATSSFNGWVSLSAGGGSLELTTADEDNYGTVSTERPLRYLTGKQVEQVIEEQGFSCERGTETSTCTAGDVQAKVVFPRPRGQGNHDIQEIELTAPAVAGGEPNPMLVAVATALSEEVIAIYGDADGAGAWVSKCFGFTTNRISQGGATLTCSPTIEGTVESPKVVQYTFQLG